MLFLFVLSLLGVVSPFPAFAGRNLTTSVMYSFLLYEEGWRNDYRRMTKVAISSLRELDGRTPIAVLRYEHTSPLNLEGLVFEFPFPSPMTKAASAQYSMTFLKLQIARLPCRMVLFFDSDVLFFSSPFFLFDMFEGPLLSKRSEGKETIAAPVAYWLRDRPLTSGGPLGVIPGKNLFRDAIGGGISGEKFDGEMDYLIRRFNASFLPFPKKSIVLVGEFAHDDPAFGTLGVGELREAISVHFVAQWKPTKLSHSEIQKRYGSESRLSHIYSLWESFDQR